MGRVGCVLVTSTVLMGDIDSWCPFYDSISGHAGPASITKHTLFLLSGTAEEWCPAATPPVHAAVPAGALSL
jgi:hypothetical protein